MARNRAVWGFVLILSVLPNVALAVVISTAAGNGADAYIQSDIGSQNSNFGLADNVLIKHDSGTGFLNRKGYFRFDLSSVSTSIVDAQLDLIFVFDSPQSLPVNTYNVFGLNNSDPGENWGETTITWNNAPGNATASGDGVLPGATSLLGTFTFDNTMVAFGDVISFTSAELVSFLSSDTNNLATIIITRQERSLGNEGFASKENTTFAAPSLDITVTSVPEPATLALISLGLAGLGVTRRRMLHA